jgi:hypothetical protein
MKTFDIQKSDSDYDLIRINKLEEYISIHHKGLDHLNSRRLVWPLIVQVESGFETIPIKISYFKHDDQIHQWVIETSKKEVERYLKLAIIQFTRSLNIPIICSNFKVRLIK